MKKVEITTKCGEVSTIYVSQDVEKIVIDGEEYRRKAPDNRLPVTGESIGVISFLSKILKLSEEGGFDGWYIDYKLEGDILSIDFMGAGLPKAIFQS